MPHRIYLWGICRGGTKYSLVKYTTKSCIEIHLFQSFQKFVAIAGEEEGGFTFLASPEPWVHE